MAPNTLFMSPVESARIQSTVRDRRKQLDERKGQPREHKDANVLIEQAISASLMQDLSSAAFGLGTSKKSKETMPAYGIGDPYPPCTKKLDDLESMRLKDLRMETHHKGYFLSLRRVSPVVILEASSWAVVQDLTSDDFERMEIFLHKSQHGHDTLDMAIGIAVKDPYYTLNTQGEATIRVDHPSDLIITALNENPEAWRLRPKDPSSLKPPSAETYKQKGNHALLKKRNYAQAHFFYTQGLKALSIANPDETLRKDLYRNRSYVNIQLRRFDEAKSDAMYSITGIHDDDLKSLDAKAYNRAGLAAYGQGEFLQAKQFFEKQGQLQPDNQHVKLHIKRVNVRLREATEGIYNMSRIVSSLPKAGGRSDAASFDGPTEIKASSGAGRGLFAIRDIRPNETILCEKAFCVAWSYEPGTFSALVCDTRENAAISVFPSGLHRSLVQKLFNNPSQVEKILDLYGDEKGTGEKLIIVDGIPIVDTFQIHDIIQRNAFGPGQQTEDEDVSNASTGLWVRASYMNHSCIPNAKKDFIGDLILVRAIRGIAAGEEITHAYDESTSFDERKAAIMRTWGFECRCPLCLVEEEESADVRQKRRLAEDMASRFVQSNNPDCASRIIVRKAKMLRQALNETYDNKVYKGLPRRSLAGIDGWLRAVSV